MKGVKNISLLFEYQKFSPNSSLEKKINEVNAHYLSKAVELDDNILDVSAAGEPNSLVKKNEGGGNLDESRNKSGDFVHSLS